MRANELSHLPLLELKLIDGGGDSAAQGLFEGYGAVFNNVDLGGDQILPGAFRRAVQAAARKIDPQFPLMLLEHGLGMSGVATLPIGVWTSLSEDERGLRVQGQLAHTSTGRDVLALLKMQPRPAVAGLSIGYRVRDAKTNPRPKTGEPDRIIKDLELIEISLVTRPMNPRARIDAVKGEAAQRARAALMQAGFGRHETETLLQNGFKALDPASGEAAAAREAAARAALERLNSLALA
ncbi:MAG: HK97 family phage prohead protease [Sphingomonadaceae bacterium]|nr:HK97 family phage prohead protease [Sphingomonadaceae bacterium]